MPSFRRGQLLFFIIFATAVVFILVTGVLLDGVPRWKPPMKYTSEALCQSQPSSPTSKSSSDWEDISQVGTPTTIVEGVSINGFTVFNNLYMYNGTFYALTSDPSKFPPRETFISKPVNMGPNADLNPTDQEFQFVDPKDASAVLGGHDIKIRGMSVIVYDPPQFMSHYYHWWGEIILGAWRIYSALHGDMRSLSPPERFILPFVDKGTWRDRAGVDGPLMRAAFPRSPIEQSGYWQDYIKLNTTVLFERVLLVNRQAAHTHPLSGLWFKMIGGTMNITAPDNFWAPVQRSVIRNMLGHPVMDPDQDTKAGPPGVVSAKPVVTYISRQSTGRRLLEKDHQGLVEALRELDREGVCEVHVAVMENMSLKEQLELAARSTIFVGVHGNGLTHQMWMPASRHSTIIEIVYPKGFLFDYEMLARNLGHRHYIAWNDTFLTYPKGSYHKEPREVKGFHSSSIPVHGPSVAQLIRERLNENK